MQRRYFMKRLAAGTTVALPLLSAAAQETPLTASAPVPAPAIVRRRYEWRMVTSWPKGLPGVGSGVERLARRLETMSDGRLHVKVYAAGELVPALQCFDAVANGVAEMAHDASYYHLSKSEACAFYTAFPFGLMASELEGWVHHGGGQALWDELYAGFGLKGFLAGNTGAQMFGWFRKEIHEVSDLKGLKMRTVGNAARVLTKLGAVVVSVPGGEIFSNLQSGTIDAAEWIGPYNDLALGLYQAAPYYYAPGFHELGPGLQLTVNKSKFDALPADLQAIIAAVAQVANDDIKAEYTARSGSALAALVQQRGVRLRRLSASLLQALGGASRELLTEIYGGGDAITRRTIDSYLAYRQAVMPWTRVGELTGMQSRRAPIDLSLMG
jgi:TRAP-type mannitol/chloroaromatic compound transport system substrate-binding protein